MVEKMDDMKAILLKMKEETLREISKSVKSGSDMPIGEPSGDIYDQASSERDRELGLLLGDREREKLRNIDEALLEDRRGGVRHLRGVRGRDSGGAAEDRPVCPLLRQMQSGHRKAAGPDQAVRRRPGLPRDRVGRRRRGVRIILCRDFKGRCHRQCPFFVVPGRTWTEHRQCGPFMTISRYYSTVTMPEAEKPYPSILGFLVHKFPHVRHNIWEQRILDGKVLDDHGESGYNRYGVWSLQKDFLFPGSRK